MKKMILTMIAAMTMALAMTATVFAEPTPQGSNDQYPLAGMLEQLGLNQTDVDGWDLNYGGNPNGMRLPATGKYYYTNSGYEGLCVYASALSGEPYINAFGEPADPIDAIANCNNYMSRDQAQQLVDAIRDFLNSFDWKNSDEMTKAKKAAAFIELASYSADADTEKHLQRTPYGVLIDKKGDCKGFSETYHLLTRLMGMDCLWLADFNHAWNYIKVNGIWYRFDAAVSNTSNYSDPEILKSLHSLDFTDLMRNYATVEMPICYGYDPGALTDLGFNQQLVDLPYVKNFNPDVVRAAMQEDADLGLDVVRKQHSY